jgi:hypothetical protein
MVNLIGWVATAKREVGKEKLPVLLDVYGIGGKLSPELRGIIDHLSDVVDEAPPAGSANVDFIRRFKNDFANFLEGYRQGGQLSSEIKDAILYFLDAATMQGGVNRAGTWGELLLELHGILTGNEAMFVKNAETPDKDEKHVEKSLEEPVKEEESPLKLKLVLPDGKGGEKELLLNLSGSGNGHGNSNGNSNGHRH